MDTHASGGVHEELVPLSEPLDDENQDIVVSNPLPKSKSSHHSSDDDTTPTVGVLSMEDDSSEDSALMTPPTTSSPPRANCLYTALFPSMAASPTHSTPKSPKESSSPLSTSKPPSPPFLARKPSNFYLQDIGASLPNRDNPDIMILFEDDPEEEYEQPWSATQTQPRPVQPIPAVLMSDDSCGDDEERSIFEQEPDLSPIAPELSPILASPPTTTPEAAKGLSGGPLMPLLVSSPSNRLTPQQSRELSRPTTTDLESAEAAEALSSSPPRSPLRPMINPQPYSSPSSSVFLKKDPSLRTILSASHDEHDASSFPDQKDTDQVDEELIGDYTLPGRTASTGGSFDEEILVDQIPSSFVHHLYGSAYDQIFCRFGLTPDNASVALSRSKSSSGHTSSEHTSSEESDTSEYQDEEEALSQQRRIPRSALGRRNKQIHRQHDHNDGPAPYQSILSTKIFFGACRLDVAMVLLVVIIAVCLCAAIAVAMLQQRDDNSNPPDANTDDLIHYHDSPAESMLEEEAAMAVPTPSPTFY